MELQQGSTAEGREGQGYRIGALAKYRLAHIALGDQIKRMAERLLGFAFDAVVGIGGPGMHIGLLMALELKAPVHVIENIGNGLEWYGPQPQGLRVLLCAAEASGELEAVRAHLERRGYEVRTLVAQQNAQHARNGNVASGGMAGGLESVWADYHLFSAAAPGEEAPFAWLDHHTYI